MSEQKTNISILAYYCFTPIEDPQAEVVRHKTFFQDKDVKARIYIARQGINGQMSAAAADAQSYIDWMRADSRFANIDFKLHCYDEHVFPKLTVKVREQLVALDLPVDLSQRGTHVAPHIWRQMLEERDDDTLLLDVRNDYEWEIGHFEGAVLPTLEQFREFPAFAKLLKETRNPDKTKIMMYCTGGIRCELYSALLKREGFENVYQLEGGVIKYGLEEGGKHWKGKLFVFDDRLAVPVAEDKAAEAISVCHHCQVTSDVYYNCADMDCNELFVCCTSCAEKFQGCCSAECQAAERRRPFQSSARPKPFRKAYTYAGGE